MTSAALDVDTCLFFFSLATTVFWYSKNCCIAPLDPQSTPKNYIVYHVETEIDYKQVQLSISHDVNRCIFTKDSPAQLKQLEPTWLAKGIF